MRYKLVIISILLLILGCRDRFTPKPRGFFRISFPEKRYHSLNDPFPYRFDFPEYANVSPDSQNPDQPWWINLTVPANRAEVHISYYNLTGHNKPPRRMLAEFMEETRELAYKHAIKANAIEEQLFVNPGEDVYGTVYRIAGNAASPIQFFLTDSSRHFLRGALYIRATPDIDSLRPVIEFLERDVIHLIETTTWE